MQVQLKRKKNSERNLSDHWLTQIGVTPSKLRKEINRRQINQRQTLARATAQAALNTGCGAAAEGVGNDKGFEESLLQSSPWKRNSRDRHFKCSPQDKNLLIINWAESVNASSLHKPLSHWQEYRPSPLPPGKVSTQSVYSAARVAAIQIKPKEVRGRASMHPGCRTAQE